TVTSGPCEAVSKKAAEDNMFLITPSGSSVNCITAGNNCFRMCFNDPQQGKLEADFIAENLSGKNRVGAIYDSTDSYSTGILDGFKEEAAAKGLEVVAEEAFTSDSNKDFSAQIQKMVDSNIDVLFLPIYYTETALILQQAEGKLDVPVVGGDGLDGLIGVLKDKVAIADGVYALTPYSATAKDEKAVKFTEAYRAKFPDADDPIQFAADGYDCVYAIKAALEKADIKDTNIDASELCNKLKEAMTEIEYKGVTGDSKWTTDGEVTKNPKVMQIKVTDGVGAFTDI
ncbi:MAG: ABC transporter substrate-binding protein, partial [Oscillospiraceae bacterium]|nr:ABC transporter substrate-binding protein [Oscillospiraceae bacterium]